MRAEHIVVQAVRSTSTSQNTVQRNFLMHSMRRGPAIQPGFQNFNGNAIICFLQETQGIRKIGSIVAVYIVGGEEFLTSANTHGANLIGVIVRKSSLHDHRVCKCLHTFEIAENLITRERLNSIIFVP